MRTLRVLAILTKRQMADDGPYLVAALLIPVALIFATAVWAFFDDSYVGFNRRLPLPTACLFAVLVVLLFAGSYLFAIRQVQADRASGVSATLSALPIGRGEILLARTLTVVLFLLVILIFLTGMIAGAVLFDLLPGRNSIRYRPSEWSLPFLVDVLVHFLLSAFLIALTCHCLGLRRACTSSPLPNALGGLPLALIFILLVIVKGFALPLVVVLLLIIVASFLFSTAGPRRHALSVVTSGLIACILICVALFCGRYLFDVILAGSASGIDRLEIRPSGLFSGGAEGANPSVARGEFRERSLLVSSVRAIRIPTLLETLGIVDFVGSRLPRQITLTSPSRSYYRLVHFDVNLGQIVDTSWRRALCIGPEGISRVSDKRLGRFTSPILSDAVLYDCGSRRFYEIDIDQLTIRKGEELPDRTWEPVCIFPVSIQSRKCFADCVASPRRMGRDSRHVAVVDRSGRIALLDRQSLEIVKWVGHLPRPKTLFGHGSGQPKDMLGYDVELVADGPTGGYVGLVACSLSRQGTALTLAVFDKDGRDIKAQDSCGGLVSTVGEPIPVVGKYLFESLHPPILTLASFFTAYSFEVGSTHRALFLMPNSFVALQRDRETSFIFQFLFALLFLLPALAFAGFLSWRVVRDAAVMGLSRKARWLWGLGTLAFGLPAYITYRLTRPKVALALCSDCGHSRRVDQETCHQCGSGWKEPILNLPAWRIMSP